MNKFKHRDLKLQCTATLIHMYICALETCKECQIKPNYSNVNHFMGYNTCTCTYTYFYCF